MRARVVVSVLVVLILAAFCIWWVGSHDPAPLAGEVASRMRAADATLYIVSDDSVSQQQVNLFGQFASQVPTVDCKEQTSVCDTLQLDEMPAIIFKSAGIEITGIQTLEEIRTVLQNLSLW